MTNPKTPPEQLPAKDWLLTRPDEEALPTPLDPAGPHSRGFPADPRPVCAREQGDPDAQGPAPGEIDHSA
ncbi:MAG TPA: hypothetical protein VKE74_13665 [Gemmataceae bacterium]|nr:hypothetical protein [Gemmataceae bacterium]